MLIHEIQLISVYGLWLKMLFLNIYRVSDFKSAAYVGVSSISVQSVIAPPPNIFYSIYDA